MRYVIALIIAGGGCFVWFHHNAPNSTAVAVAQTITEPRDINPAASGNAGQNAASNVLKRPLDRTHEVLDQVRKNNAGNEF